MEVAALLVFHTPIPVSLKYHMKVDNRYPLQRSALIFFVAIDNIPTTDRSRIVLFTLEVAIDGVVGDCHTACVLEGLKIAIDAVTGCLQLLCIGIEQSVLCYLGVFNACTTDVAERVVMVYWRG